MIQKCIILEMRKPRPTPQVGKNLEETWDVAIKKASL